MLLQNGLIYDSDIKAFFPGDIYIDNAKISRITTSSKSSCKVDRGNAIDANGLYVIPGLIDIHTHGALGFDFIFSKDKELSLLSNYYLKYGVTTVFPTIITASLDKILSSIEIIKDFIKQESLNINIGGIHLEGPYISKDKKGAHDIRYIRLPDIKEIDAILSKADGLPLYFTIAPEVDGALHIISYLKAKGINVSIGHSSAKGETVYEALKRGAVSFTHLFNAMSPLHHRDEGIVSVALDSDAYVELICDGIHLSPSIVRLVHKAKSPEKIILVSDSILTTRLPDGEYLYDDTLYVVKDGLAKVDNTIAGSSLNMLDALRNYIRYTGITLEEALPAATLNPAKATGISHLTGSLKAGKRADLLLTDKNLNLVKVISKGRIIDIQS